MIATVLAAACTAPRAPSPREEARSAPVADVSVAPVAVRPPADAGADAVPVDASRPTIDAPVDPLVDEAMLPPVRGEDFLPPFRFVEGEWSQVPPSALPAGTTFVGEIVGNKIVRGSGAAPSDEEILRATGARPDAALVWVENGRVTVGRTRDLRRALAPIDTAEKARVLVEYGHHRTLEWQKPGTKTCVGCAGRFVRKSARGSIEVVGRETLSRPGPCPHSNFEEYPALVVYEVGADGMVRRTAKDVSPWPPPRATTHATPCVGRDSDGSGRRYVEPRSLGAYLAQLAHDEAVSIRAFERLARELERAEAPRALVVRARRAARDEARHARVMASLAIARAGSIAPVEWDELPARTLREWAIENAIEGCVRETYNAAVAAYQTANVADPAARRALTSIARDEAEHAALAWDVHAWALSVADDALAFELARAIDRAYAELEVHVGAAPERAFLEGWTPPRATATAIARGLRASLAA